MYGDRQVSKQEAERFAQSEGMMYMEASAKTNKNVEEVFTKLASEMKNKHTKIPEEKQDNKRKKQITLVPQKPVNVKGAKTTCC